MRTSIPAVTHQTTLLHVPCQLTTSALCKTKETYRFSLTDSSFTQPPFANAFSKHNYAARQQLPISHSILIPSRNPSEDLARGPIQPCHLNHHRHNSIPSYPCSRSLLLCHTGRKWLRAASLRGLTHPAQ
ncbi:unnamed protein product [Periconia digitata]|uniref:Uncharacterized protein n=1 Tax=Periconia digitata TaxID=1303443 RepID=A0A9W4XXC4_9PLEO|nr:unnamed protein product [Periconia digitata]